MIPCLYCAGLMLLIFAAPVTVSADPTLSAITSGVPHITDSTPTRPNGSYADATYPAARVGDTTVILTLVGSAKGRRQGLPWLLRQAVSRIPT